MQPHPPRLRSLILVLLFAIAPLASSAPLSGTKTVGPTGDYASLTAAITDIQTQTLGGALVLELQGTYLSSVETFPLTIPGLNGASAANTLTIRPQVGATGLSISNGASFTDATVDLNGAQFVTFDGRPGGMGSNAGSGVGTASQLTIGNTKSTGAALSFKNEASNNTIKFVTIKSVNTSGTSGTVDFSTTTGANGNDNNMLDHCDIREGASPPWNGINSRGSTGTPAQANSGNTVANCNIFNFYSTSGFSSGVLLSNGSTDWTISGNSFYQTVSRIPNGNFYPIYISNTSGNNYTVTGNFIGGSAPNCGGTAWTSNDSSTPCLFVGILLTAGTTTPSSVQGNTISNIVWRSGYASTMAPGVWSGIYLQAGSANIGTETGNTIGSATGTGSISVTAGEGVTFGICSVSGSGGTVAIANNTIGSITTSGAFTSVSASLYGIWAIGSSVTISHNTVGSTTTANSLNAATASTSTTDQQVTGILGINATGNTVANLNNNYAGTGSTGQIRGIVSSKVITGNTVRNLSTTSRNFGTGSSASVLGIVDTSTAEGQTVSQNIVHSLANTAATATVSVTGIYYAGPVSGTNVIARNFVHSLAISSTSISSMMKGMEFGAGTFTARNNLVRVGLKADGTSTAGASSVRGIYDNGTDADRNFYHNSVYVGGNQTSGSGSRAFDCITGVGNAHGYCNNIFVNARSNTSGTSKHYAVRYDGTTANPTGLTANNNLFLASGNGGVLGLYGGADRATLSEWQTATGLDANSQNADPLFVKPTGTSSTVNLHIASGSPVINAGAIDLGVIDDYDGENRDANPDIGADEIVTAAAPEIAVSGNAANIADGDNTPSSMDFTDFGSTELGGGTVTRTFTIANTGTAALNLTGTPKVAVGGNNAADFTVTAQPASLVAAGGTTTFQVTFAPGDLGPRTATLSIVNGDADENPFDFAISGTGLPSANASLTALAISSSQLDSTFNSGVFAYSATVPNSVSSLTVTPTTADGNATVTVNGSSPSTPVALVAGANSILVHVTAQNGVTSLDYTITVHRNTLPTLGLPPSPVIIAEAIAPGGAPVNFSVTGSDLEDGVLAPDISPASGTTFPLGDTIVNASATDSVGESASGSFIVRVVDTTAPVLTPPANVTVHATSPAGAIATYSAAVASDSVGVVSLTYSLDSGMAFPVGDTYVTVTAKDAANNTSTATFTVTVTPLGLREIWRYTHFGIAENTGTAADLADFDGDGVVNLLEFAFGSNPTDPAIGRTPLAFSGTFALGGTITAFGQPSVVTEIHPNPMDPGNIPGAAETRLLMVRRKDAATVGLAYTVRISTDLTHWTDLATVPSVLADDGIYEIVSYTFPALKSGETGHFTITAVNSTGP